MQRAGTNFSLPRVSAAGHTVYPPPRATPGPVENQGYRSIPLTSFQGSAADAAGQAQVLVVYHHYESLTTCEEDEEIQVIRGNLLSFLRWMRPCPQLSPALSMPGRRDLLAAPWADGRFLADCKTSSVVSLLCAVKQQLQRQF